MPILLSAGEAQGRKVEVKDIVGDALQLLEEGQ